MAIAVFVFPLLIVALLVVLYLYLRRNYNYWKKRNIPSIEPSIIGGNTLSVLFLRKSICDRIDELHRQSNEPFVGIITLDTPALLVRDKEFIKNIFIKDFNHFVDRSFAVNEELEPLAGNGIFGLKGEKWQKLRVKLTPTFTSGKMKNMFYLVRAQAERLDSLLKPHVKTQESLQTKNVFSRYTTDVIAACVFGIDGKAIDDPNWIFMEMWQSVFRLSLREAVKMVLMFTAPWILKTFHVSVFSQKYHDIIRDTVWKTINSRKKNNIYRHDFIDLLLEVREQTLAEKEKDPKAMVLDGDALVAQAFGFLIAGSETSSHTITLTLYEMALNQEIQDRAREEVRAVLKKYNGELTYDGIKEMTYLKQCIDETLRVYPVLPFIDRICTKEYPIPGSKYKIEKDMKVFVSVTSLHRDPTVFPNPDKYDPDRFTEDKLPDYKFSYFPFGEGPRNCIGMRFGIMQVKVGLAHLLNKYRVEPAADTPIPPKFDVKAFNLLIQGDIPLLLKECP